MTPHRQIRARHDAETITVYQAYSDEIADAALAAGTFAPPFKRTRMTWIKPSFRWMLYRSGWARKDVGQHRVLAIDMTREGFEWALRNSCLSDRAPRLGRQEARRLLDASPVRVQWDPERDVRLQPLDHRSIQIGLSGEAVERYVDEWICEIADVTDRAHDIGDAVRAGNLDLAETLLPREQPYVLPADIAHIVGATEESNR